MMCLCTVTGSQRTQTLTVSGHAPTETAEDYNKDAFYDELYALISKIPSEQVAFVRIDEKAKMGLEQQLDVLGDPMEQTSDNEKTDVCEQTNFIIVFTFERSHRRH
ncbi:hypothetical protein RB195_021930 [Necator americanus]|uniref:Uncharacterized protein n=1 Tax=Necator americanus TaxID=51031 RepID=A0ABR1EDA6_NECAM